MTGPANASELRELQAPIKERSCSVNTGQALVRAGLHPVVLQTLAGSPELSVSLERR